MAEHRAGDDAGQEKSQHAKMPCQPQAVAFVIAVAVVPFLGQTDAHLPDVVGHKGGGHRYPFRLAEGIVLHGGQKIDGHLGNLHRGAVRHKAQQEDGGHFQPQQQGVPAHAPVMFDGIGGQLRDEGTQDVG